MCQRNIAPKVVFMMLQISWLCLLVMLSIYTFVPFNEILTEITTFEALQRVPGRYLDIPGATLVELCLLPTTGDNKRMMVPFSI